MRLPASVGCRRPESCGPKASTARSINQKRHGSECHHRHAEFGYMVDPKRMLWASLDMLLNLKGCKKRELLTGLCQPGVTTAYLSKATCLLRILLPILSKPVITSPGRLGRIRKERFRNNQSNVGAVLDSDNKSVMQVAILKPR